VKGKIIMKIKEGFLLREVAGQTIVLPVGEDLDLNMMITLNETGHFLWEQLQKETDEDRLVSALLKEYDVEEKVAVAAVRSFVKKLNENGFLC